MASTSPPGRVLWRCRRGMQELDIMLEGFARQHWPTLSDSARRQFETLLDTEDDQLWAWLSGQRVCQEESLVGLVTRIRQS